MSNSDDRDREIAELKAQVEQLTGTGDAKAPPPTPLAPKTATTLPGWIIPVFCAGAVIVAVVVIINYGGRNQNAVVPETTGGGAGNASAVAPPASTPTDIAARYRPPDEAAFIGAVDDAGAAYKQALNEMAKGGTRGQRKAAICGLLRSRNVNGWTGLIAGLGTNSEGKGVLTVDLGDGTKVQTWNNALSDIGSDTLIESASPLFNTLSKFAKGDAVKFSGSFFDDETDCVRELSFVSLAGSMTNPEFLMRFSSVEKLDETSTAAPTPTVAPIPTSPPTDQIPPTATQQVPVFPSVSAEQTSFNCAKARSFAEITICHDAELATLDRRLSVTYENASSSDTTGQVRAGARAAWHEREACQTRQCLLVWYTTRFAQLKPFGDPDAYRCSHGDPNDDRTIQACDRNDSRQN